MKNLVIYLNDSRNIKSPMDLFRYLNLYEEHSYEINENNILTIYKRNPATGEETAITKFKEWQYLQIEEDYDE